MPRTNNSGAHSDIVSVGVRDGNGNLRRVALPRTELVRRAQAASVARQTLYLAENVHINEAGRRLVLDHQWRQIYADPSTDMRIIAPAQRGKTLYQIVKTFAQLMLGMAVGWVLPKEAKVRQLVHDKLDPTIKATELYRSLIGGGGGNDTVSFKTMGDYGRLHLVTSNSKDELTAFSADAMHVDERDFCNKDNLPMYPARMNRSPYKLTDEISTCTIDGRPTRVGVRGIDNIHSEFLKGDQLRYYTPCPHCGHQQILDWYDNVVTVELDESGRIMKFDVLDQEWSPGSPIDLRVCCSRCKRPFERTTPGRWLALNPGVMMRSYWVEALASIHGPTVAQLLDDFGNSLGNPTKSQHFHNLMLGRTYSGGMLKFSEEIIQRCVKPGRRMLQSCDGPCTIGIDVNRPWLDVQISRWDQGQQIKVYADKLQGGEDQILDLIRRFNIKGGVIDGQPEAKFSMSVQERAGEIGCDLIRCRYATSEMQKLYTVSEAGENPKLDAPRLITVSRTIGIDGILEEMQKQTIEWFEEWSEILQGALLEEFTTPVRKLVVNEQTGTERFAWEGKPDHALHVALLDRLAGEILGMTILRDYSRIGPFVTPISHDHQSMGPETMTPKAVIRDDGVMIFRG